MESILTDEDYEKSKSRDVEGTSYHERSARGPTILPAHEEQERINEVRRKLLKFLWLWKLTLLRECQD